MADCSRRVPTHRRSTMAAELLYSVFDHPKWLEFWSMLDLALRSKTASGGPRLLQR